MVPDATEPQPGTSAAVSRRAEVAPEIARVRFVPAAPRKGEEVRVVAEVSDMQPNIALDHVWTIGGVRQAARGPVVTLSRGVKGDAVEVSVTAQNGTARSEPVYASTEIVNSAPVLQSVRIEAEQGLVADGEVSAIAEATDGDRDKVSFEYIWRVNGSTVPEEGSTLSTASLRHGDRIALSVVATDGWDPSDSVDAAEVALANADPVFVSSPEPAGADGVFRYRPRAEDPDGDRSLHFSLGSAPAGMTIQSVSGSIEWQPSEGQAGKHLVEVVVEDSEGGRGQQSFEVVVGEPEAAGAPPASR
jgi:hypothetical protein